MTPIDCKDYFEALLIQDPDVSPAIAAIRTLLMCLQKEESGTLQGLLANLRNVIETLKNTDASTVAVVSGCELCLQYITSAFLEYKELDKCKNVMTVRGQHFLKRIGESRRKISKLAASFIQDNAKILTHSKSRVVFQALKEAAEANLRFHVYITQSQPDQSGEDMMKMLIEEGIPCTLILDSAIGYIMEKIDLCMVGAEGVVESGGIINKIGTYSMAINACAINKPFYVLAESFKFMRVYPLNQRDLADEFKHPASILASGSSLEDKHPLVDLTPPKYITLLFTDLGILTPSAVSDELIKLYH